jgi:cytidyltransferase-like protein
MTGKESLKEGKRNKVFVSGCFDRLHSGHIEFFRQAAKYGDIYVSVGSDATYLKYRGKKPWDTENERLFMVQSIKFVKRAFIARPKGEFGIGILDFKEELKRIKPDIFIVNEDGDKLEKRKYIEGLGIKYVVLKRKPHRGLPIRSTTAIKNEILSEK